MADAVSRSFYVAGIRSKLSRCSCFAERRAVAYAAFDNGTSYYSSTFQSIRTLKVLLLNGELMTTTSSRKRTFDLKVVPCHRLLCFENDFL